MSINSGDLIAHFNKLWPLEGAESWDAPGLIVGSENRRISRVLLSVDVTSEVVSEAIDGQFDLVLSHHPFIMRGVSSLAESTAKGSVLTQAIRSGVDLYAAHTNADIVEHGVSAALANSLGITEAVALEPAGEAVGHGRIGALPAPVKLGEFARLVSRVLPSTAQGVRVSGDYDRLVQRIAVCGGAGDSFIAAAESAAADVYLTSDLRHHPVQDSRERSILSGNDMALIDIAHWAGEWLWLELAAEQLSKEFSTVQFVVSHLRTDPWDFLVTQ
jgi:dinuclear metal center YbgI/SA1388 family protein